jgi:DNA primase
MAFISKATIQEVNDKLDAVAVVGDYVRLEKKGGRYWGLCPFHNEKTPSFTVDPDRKMYHCFGCGQGGGIITFVMEMDKLTFPEAVETLARRHGVEIVYEKGSVEVPEDSGRKVRLEELAELYRRVTVSFHHFLTEKPEGRKAYEYLLSRGITRETIDVFRLGFAPANRNWLFQFLIKKGYSEPFLASSGLFSERYPRMSFFSNRLMFPISNRQGQTVAFGGRIVPGGEHSDEQPKYINSREFERYKKGETLFAIDLALPAMRKTKEVYLCEGYMDVIALHQAGITNAAAPLGTAFTDEQAKLLRRWVEKFNLVFDTDDAGQTAAVKAILTGRRNQVPCAVVVPGEALQDNAAENTDVRSIPKDPADILQFFGPESLKKSMKWCIYDFEYLLNRGKILYDISNPEGKAKAIAFLFPYLETLDSDISRDECAGAAADAYGTDKTAVLRDFGRRHTEKPRVQDGKQLMGNVTMNDELFPLVTAAVYFDWYPKFRTALSIKDVEDPAAKELFIALEECFINEESGIDSLLSRISSAPLRNFISERAVSKEFSGDPEQLIGDGIRRIKVKRLRRRRGEIVTKMKLCKNNTEPVKPGEGLEDLIAEKMHIDDELRTMEGK